MSLLQISDPLQGAVPVGIDLGTTHSLIAYVTPTGDAVTLRVCDDNPLLPSVVHYAEGGQVIVGNDALPWLTTQPSSTLTSVKRFMGRALGDTSEEDRRGYIFDAQQVPTFMVSNNKPVTPVEASAEILKELKRRAEKRLGNIGAAVITVPAYFDDAQRQATKDAGRLAGLDVKRLLNEPTAAALAYGLDKKKNGLFVVYDLGGGTFDVTVLSLDDGVFQVRAVGGDSHLGGDDMDDALSMLVEKQLTHGPIHHRQLKLLARQIKHQLSQQTEVNVQIELEGHCVDVSIARDAFESAIAPLLQRTTSACKRALRDAGISPKDVDGVIMVGGATRVPAVHAAVKAIFGDKVLADIDPDQVVALGAAHQAGLLASRSDSDVLLLDVLPLSLGVEAMGGVVERILPRNTPIPAAAAQIFTTYADNQTGLVVHVVQGERELASDNRSLAKFTLKGIPPMAAGMARIEVRFEVDENGLLKVSAQELSTDTKAEVKVEPSYGLSHEAMARMLEEADAHAEEDVLARNLAEQRIEAKRMMAAVEKAMKEDAELLLDDEKEKISCAISRLAQTIEGHDPDAIAEATAEVDRITKPFAGRRMEAHMKRALRGRDLETVEKETVHAEGIERHLG